jgi:hypothetical protein
MNLHGRIVVTLDAGATSAVGYSGSVATGEAVLVLSSLIPVVPADTGESLQVQLQESNDNLNFVDVGSAADVDTDPMAGSVGEVTGFVRLKLSYSRPSGGSAKSVLLAVRLLGRTSPLFAPGDPTPPFGTVALAVQQGRIPFGLPGQPVGP